MTSLTARIQALESRYWRAPIMLEIGIDQDADDALADYRRRFNSEPAVILSGIPTRQYEPNYPA